MDDELTAAIAGLRGPTTHTSHIDTVLAALTAALAERDQLAAENAALREALETWWRIGAASGVVENLEDAGWTPRGIIATTHRLLFADSTPAVAEIERLVAIGRQMEGFSVAFAGQGPAAPWPVECSVHGCDLPFEHLPDGPEHKSPTCACTYTNASEYELCATHEKEGK